MVPPVISQSMFLLLVLVLMPQLRPDTSLRRGAWSGEAISLFNTWGALEDNPNRNVIIYSPNHKNAVRVIGEKVTALIGGKEFPTDFAEKKNAELGWAPDSSRFFLTWTDGGETGTWHTQVYEVIPSGLKENSRLTQAARKNFESQIRSLPIDLELDSPDKRKLWDNEVYCEANVVGSQWLGTHDLLISVLVPNTGHCRYMSEFNVYRISVPEGRILGRYGAKEAYRRFKQSNLPLISR
jgi:hypothetical protein